MKHPELERKLNDSRFRRRFSRHWLRFLLLTLLPLLLVTLHLLAAVIAADGLVRASPSATVLLSAALGLVAGWACIADSRRLGHHTAFSVQQSLLFLWPLTVPTHLLEQRGAMGLLAAFLLAGTLSFAAACGAIAMLLLRVVIG